MFDAQIQWMVFIYKWSGETSGKKIKNNNFFQKSGLQSRFFVVL